VSYGRDNLAVALLIGSLVTPASAAAGDGAALHAGLVAAAKRDPAAPGIAATVIAPGVRWSGAVGRVRRGGSARLEPTTPFRIASNTKTFTAAAVLRLVEEHRLRLDDPLTRRLPGAYVRELRAGGYDPGHITVEQLLRHQSGLRDYASDPSYVAAVAAAPAKRWTRIEQVRFAMRLGPPLFAPGTRFAYSDTGYILLGQIIQTATGRPMPAAYRALLRWRRLGLRHTWFESLESPPAHAGALAHQYFGDRDAHDLDPSFDLWGGGGIVSTTPDLARFYDALLAGRVLRPATLRIMVRTGDVPDGHDAAMGLFVRTIAGARCYSHTGFWGSEVIVCPHRHVTVATTVNHAGATGRSPADALLAVQR
jgi:D-alanyl-D-alanine carboxypeptidase